MSCSWAERKEHDFKRGNRKEKNRRTQMWAAKEVEGDGAIDRGRNTAISFQTSLCITSDKRAAVSWLSLH